MTASRRLPVRSDQCAHATIPASARTYGTADRNPTAVADPPVIVFTTEGSHREKP